MIVFEDVDQLFERCVVQTASPGKIKTRFRLAALMADFFLEMTVKMARTLCAKRRDVVFNGIKAWKAEKFRRGMVFEKDFAEKTIRGINEITQSFPEKFQHGSHDSKCPILCQFLS